MVLFIFLLYGEKIGFWVKTKKKFFALNPKLPFVPIGLQIVLFERASNSAQKTVVYIIDEVNFLMMRSKKK
jgi:uncharacterized membrane protein